MGKKFLRTESVILIPFPSFVESNTAVPWQVGARSLGRSKNNTNSRIVEKLDRQLKDLEGAPSVQMADVPDRWPTIPYLSLWELIIPFHYGFNLKVVMWRWKWKKHNFRILRRPGKRGEESEPHRRPLLREQIRVTLCFLLAHLFIDFMWF